jgi:hypothetical protein
VKCDSLCLGPPVLRITTRHKMYPTYKRNIEELSRIIVVVEMQHILHICMCVCARAWACACACVNVALIIQHEKLMRPDAVSMPCCA